MRARLPSGHNAAPTRGRAIHREKKTESGLRTGSAGDRSAKGYAGLTARLFAFAIDSILLTAILCIVVLASNAAFGPVVGFPPVAGNEAAIVVHPTRVIAVAIAGIALSAAYFIGSWTAFRATPGQRLLRIRVRRSADLRQLTLRQAATRWLLLMGPLSLGGVLVTLLPSWRTPVNLSTLAWWPILLLTTARSPVRRGLHDRHAGSVVVSGAQPVGTNAAS